MIFAGSLRRSRLFIGRTLLGSSRSGSGQGRSWPNEAKSSRPLPCSSALLVIAGSSCFLGYDYFGLGGNSIVSFAESDTDEIVWDSGDDYVVPSKKSRFIFGGEECYLIMRNAYVYKVPPVKVFEYFASLRTPEKEVLMTPGDLMRAVAPVFPLLESDRVREGFLREEKAPGELQCDPSQFCMLFDTNGDGLISFPELIVDPSFSQHNRRKFVLVGTRHSLLSLSPHSRFSST